MVRPLQVRLADAPKQHWIEPEIPQPAPEIRSNNRWGGAWDKGVATVFAYRNRWLKFFGYCGDPILVLALPEAPAMYVVILDMLVSVSQHDCLTISPWLKLRTMIQ